MNCNTYENTEIEELKARRRTARLKAKVAKGASIVFYTIGLASVVALGRKYSLQNIDVDSYVKDTIILGGASSVMGAIAKYTSSSYEKEVAAYDDAIAEEETAKKFIR